MSTRRSKPQAPRPQEPGARWTHRALYDGVQEALLALPSSFKTETYLTGILATDLHTLNTVLGASIEEQTVETLNANRSIWDPDGAYALYRFVRQPQAFPDVVLRKIGSIQSDGNILMGIELKGWYVLAKEAVPTFRYKITPKACATADLLCVVPWALSQVISGHPTVFAPFITPARFAAEYRNYHWQHIREAKTDSRIKIPLKASPYPARGAHVDDLPESDAGGNFGRFARTGLMDEFIRETLSGLLCGVPLSQWLDFFKSLPNEG